LGYDVKGLRAQLLEEGNYEAQYCVGLKNGRVLLIKGCNIEI